MQLSLLRKQYFGGERAVLAVAADVPVQPLHDGVDADKTEAMPLALGAAEQPSLLLHFLPGGKIGEGDVELGIFHIHIDPDEALVLRQLHAGLNGVVEEIAEDAAEIDLRGLQPDGDVGIGRDLDALRLCKGDLGVEDGVGHGIAGLDDRVHGLQIGVQQVEVVSDGVPISRGSVSLHGLDMVAVVVPPAADLAVHIVYFAIMRFDQLLLIGGDLLFDFLCKQAHTPYLMLIMARLTPSYAPRGSGMAVPSLSRISVLVTRLICVRFTSAERPTR